MAEAEVAVVARAIGFEQVASEARKAMEAFRQLDKVAASLRSGSKGGSLFAGFSKDMASFEKQLIEIRRVVETTSTVMRERLGAGLGTSLTESISSPGITARFRERGEELGRALRQGVDAVLNQTPALRVPSAGGNGSGSGGGSGQGGPSGPGGNRPAQYIPPARVDHIQGVLAGTVAGHATVEATKSIFEQAGELAQVRAQLKSQGISDTEIADVEVDARKISATHKATTIARLLQSYGEFRTVFPHADEARHFMPMSADLDSALKNLRTANTWAKDVEPDQASLDVAKSLELRGSANDEKRARNDINMIMKGMAAFKGQVLPADYVMGFRYARGALRGYSDDFLFTVFPTLMAEFKSRGGTSGGAGTVLRNFYDNTAKGRMTRKQRAEWEKFDLLDERGRTVDLDLARANPFEWWQKNIAPKLKGLTVAKQRDVISQLFPNAIPEQMANIFQQDVARLKKDRENILKASGLDDLKDVFKDAPTQAMAEFTSQFRNLLAAMGDPAMPAAIGSLKGLASIFTGLTGAMKDHPALTGLGLAGAGAGVGYGVYRALPFLLRSPFGRFALGAVTGGLLGGGLEGLLIGGALGLGAGGAVEGAAGGAARVAPGLARLRSVSLLKGGLLGRIAARVGGWLGFVRELPKALGLIGSLARALTSIPVFLGYEAATKTETGQAWLKFVQDYARYSRDKILGADAKTLDADRTRLAQSHRTSNNMLNALIFGAEPTPQSPQIARTLKYLRMARNSEWLSHVVPSTPAPVLTSFFGTAAATGRGARFAQGSGPRGGPVPVVVQSMPKGQDRPNNIVVNNTINVTASGLNAVGGAIAGAVGPATASSVSNALSDGHH